MKKFTGILAALSLASALTVSAGAQNVIDDIINGAENVVDDTADTAEDIVNGGNDNGNGNDTVGGSGTDNPDLTPGDGNDIADNTNDPDIPDQIEDDTNDNPTAGKDENTVIKPPTEEDPNPSTGVPFMTAGLVALSAAGVAYLSKRRNDDR